MNTYHFTILVRDADSSDSDLEEKLSELDCGNVLIQNVNNIVCLSFQRPAFSAKEAIESALHDLNQIGFYDLIVQEKGVSSLAEIAKRLGVSRTTMSHYVSAKRGMGHFPKPVAGVLSGSALYSWHEVADWLYQQNKLSKADYEVAQAAVEF